MKAKQNWQLQNKGNKCKTNEKQTKLKQNSSVGAARHATNHAKPEAT